MEYLITTEEFNKRYSKKITNKIKGIPRLSRTKRRELLAKTKTQRKQREYHNRIPKKYATYIKSIWWTKRKNKYYQEHKRQCVICGSSSYCDLHHIVYRNNEFGSERDEDLTCLCRNCHEDYHLQFGVSGNMQESFAEYCASRVNNPII